MIYLDSAATTLQKPPQVPAAAARAISELASPGRGGHLPAKRAAETVFACRQAAAGLFEAESPEQVVFTSNATHGLNIAIRSLVRPGDKVLISGYEHNAVTRPLHGIEGVQIETVSSPLFAPEEMEREFDRRLTQEVRCVVITQVSNVFGYILPVEAVAALCRERKIPFVLDASQSAGCLPVRFRELGAEFVAMPGHKGLYGPQGTGILLCARGGEPLLRGGTGSRSLSQDMPDFLPDRLEAGTHNVCGIAGLLEGIRFVQRTGVQKIFAHERKLLERAAGRLEKIPGLECFCSADLRRQAGVLSLRLRGWDCEELGAELGRRGIAVRAGFHCAPAAHSTAGTLETGTVRVSFSAFNRMWEVEKLGEIMEELARKKP